MIRSRQSHLSRFRAWRTGAAVLVCITAAACRSVWQPQVGAHTDSYASQFDLLWSRYDHVYPSFKLKNIDWNASRALYRPRALAARSQDEFIAVAREMLDPLRDLHVWFVDPRGQIVPTYRPSALPNFDQTRWRHAMHGTDYVAHGSGWGEATLGGYGYLFIGTWNPGQTDINALDKALARLKDLPGMIIDVRPNAGGSDSPAYSFVGRFTAHPFVASYLQVRTGNAYTDLSEPKPRMISPRGPWQYTKPVIVIAGRGGFSANESFVAAMRALPQVTVIGDTTGGASGNPVTLPLGNGWQFTVPQWIELAPDHQPIEGHGIAPHVPIAWYSSLIGSDGDPLIDAAIGILGERSGVYRISPGNLRLR